MTTNQGTAGQGVGQGRGAMRDHDAAAHRNAIEAAEYVRARMVDQPRKSWFRYIIIGAASAVLWVAIYVIWGAL